MSGLIQVPFGHTMVSRVAPLLPAHGMTTYQVAQPVQTHWRPATCAEVECPNWLNGWRVRVEGLDPAMLHAAMSSGRKWPRAASPGRDVAGVRGRAAVLRGQLAPGASRAAAAVHRARRRLARQSSR